MQRMIYGVIAAAIATSAQAEQTYSVALINCGVMVAAEDAPEIFRDEFILYLNGVIDGALASTSNRVLAERAIRNYCEEFSSVSVDFVLENVLYNDEVIEFYAERTVEVRALEFLESREADSAGE